MFHLALNVIYLDYPFYEFKQLTKIRAELLQSNEVLCIEDFGAGSKVFKGNKRVIKDIARHGISSNKYAALLFRLVNHFQPKHIIELGTSLGLTSMYMAMAAKKAVLYSIEGSDALFKFSSSLFEKNSVSNINSIHGKFEECLPTILTKLHAVDFVFIDGHHDKDATIKYFQLLLEKTNDNTVLVFDDIHWSKGMEEAWNTIRKHERVKISIDLFYMGILLFRKEQKEQEHFVVRF
jgi:predicted O-methyltransferase YrrM